MYNPNTKSSINLLITEDISPTKITNLKNHISLNTKRSLFTYEEQNKIRFESKLHKQKEINNQLRIIQYVQIYKKIKCVRNENNIEHDRPIKNSQCGFLRLNE